ncbi:MAG: hypothetical protein O3A92_12965 [Verrucomicrobia bacterium]|nr:hypothetical protein [Verrucomicrobiota bacterium]
MARKLIIVIALVLALGLSGTIGFQLGVVRRPSPEAKEASPRVWDPEDLPSLTSRALFLGMALRKERNADATEAADLRNRVLLGTLARMDEILKSPDIDPEKRINAERFLRSLIEELEANPKDLEFLDRLDVGSANARQEWEDRFAKYRTSLPVDSSPPQ